MVAPREPEANFSGAGRKKKNDKTKQLKVSLREQAADLWVIQAKVLVVGQQVMSEYPR